MSHELLILALVVIFGVVTSLLNVAWKQEARKQYEEGYYQGYADHVLGRGRNTFRKRSVSAEREATPTQQKKDNL